MFSRTQNTPAQIPPNNPGSGSQAEQPNESWENGLWFESTRATIEIEIDPTRCECHEEPPCCTGTIGVETRIVLEPRTGTAGGGGFTVVPTPVEEDEFTRKTGRNRLRLKPGRVTPEDAKGRRDLEGTPDGVATATLTSEIPCEDGEYLRRFTFLPTRVVDQLENEDRTSVVPGADPVVRPAFLDLRFAVEDCGCDVDVRDAFLVNFATALDEVSYFEALFQEESLRPALESLPEVDAPGLPFRPRNLRNVFRLVQVKGTTVDRPFPPKGETENEEMSWEDFVSELEDVLED